jgi:tetratricopeptide (TPR) repeat protein
LSKVASREAPHPDVVAMIRAVATELASQVPPPRWKGIDMVAIVSGALLLVASIMASSPWGFLAGALIAGAGYVLFFYRVHRARHAYRKLVRIVHAQRRCRKAMYKGKPDHAVPAAVALLADFPESIAPWHYVNDAVCANINAGRYREALMLASTWSADARAEGTRLDPNSWALVEINLAEAEYNLGDLDAATDRMVRLEQALQDTNGPFQGRTIDRIVEAGLQVQHAWILCLRNDGGGAEQRLARVSDDCFPVAYRSEMDFTRALALATATRFAEAHQAIAVGLQQAERVSSRRNGLYLKAMIAAREGALEEACELFETGAAHKYKGQGGDALLEWGRVLTALGLSERAAAAWRLCLERDPQSAAATAARAALTP